VIAFSVLDSEPSVWDRDGAKDSPPISSEITFDNVHFAYQKKKVLDGIGLTVKKGESLALVGSSGSGKTTLVNLVPRFYDVTEGSIKIDGTDIRDITLNSLRRQISSVNRRGELELL